MTQGAIQATQFQKVAEVRFGVEAQRERAGLRRLAGDLERVRADRPARATSSRRISTSWACPTKRDQCCTSVLDAVV